MIKVLYPINIDQWSRSISSKLREIALRSPGDLHYYSFSSPQTDEDRRLAPAFWAHPTIHRQHHHDLLRARYDVVHIATGTPANTAAWMLASLRSLGRTRTAISVSLEMKPGLSRYYALRKQLARTADVLIANSQAVADSVVTAIGRRVDWVIPNGVDTVTFAPEAAAAATLQRHQISGPYALFVGVLAPRKRPDLFLDLARRMPDLTFVLVGVSTSYGAGLLAAAPPNVRYLAAVPKAEVRDLLGFATALVFPSEAEGLPNAVLEAIAMGVPVLAQPASSLPEIVLPNQTGWLLPVDALDAWAAQLGEVATWSGEQRTHFAAGARAFALQHHSWDRYAEQHVAIYRALVAAP